MRDDMRRHFNINFNTFIILPKQWFYCKQATPLLDKKNLHIYAYIKKQDQQQLNNISSRIKTTLSYKIKWGGEGGRKVWGTSMGEEKQQFKNAAEISKRYYKVSKKYSKRGKNYQGTELHAVF